MPRQPRLDAPGVLHHAMVRGLERHVIFKDDTDRADFIARVAALAAAGSWTVYAWALLPNHAHLLVRTGSRPLPRCMRSLLTGYAGAFNRRHKRVGHLSCGALHYLSSLWRVGCAMRRQAGRTNRGSVPLVEGAGAAQRGGLSGSG